MLKSLRNRSRIACTSGQPASRFVPGASTRCAPSASRPEVIVQNVEIVHCGDSATGEHRLFHLRHVDARGRGFQQHIHRFDEQLPGAR